MVIAYSKALRYGNTQFYLQSLTFWRYTNQRNKSYLSLLPSLRASPSFGWYSFYHPTEDRTRSRPGWVADYIPK